MEPDGRIIPMPIPMGVPAPIPGIIGGRDIPAMADMPPSPDGMLDMRGSIGAPGIETPPSIVGCEGVRAGAAALK